MTAPSILGTLCITLARLGRADRDGLQGVFLQSIAQLLARKATQQTARVRAITDRRELCRESLASRGSRFAPLASFLFAIIFIAGCAYKAAPTAINDPENQSKNGPWAGRISLQIQSQPPQGVFTGFELRGSAEQGELTLLSPIGSVLGLLRWSPTEALLESGRDVKRFSSVDALLEQTIGAPIPTTALFDWLRGKNTEAKGWSANLTRQNSGRITARRLEPAPQIDLRIVLDH